MKELLQNMIGTNTFGRPFALPATPPSEIKPAQIVLHSDGMPSDEGITDLFRQGGANADKPDASSITLKHTDSDRVEVYLTGDSAASLQERRDVTTVIRSDQDIRGMMAQWQREGWAVLYISAVHTNADGTMYNHALLERPKR